MATAYPRESAFMPTVKCSQCGNEVEISLMGSHICKGPSNPEPPPPAAAGPDIITGAFASLKQTVWGFGSRAAPPAVDTSAANEVFSKADQLTPVSDSTGSRTISPRTPTGRSGDGPNSGEFFSPAIADVTSPEQSGRPGGYGGFGDPQAYEPEPMYYGSSPNKEPAQPPAAPSLLQRMNSIAPGPFELGRRAAAKNAFALRNDQRPPPEGGAEEMASNVDGNEGPSANGSNAPSTGMAPPRVPRKNGYGGFGPPEQTDSFEPRPLGASQRSETFPKQSQSTYDDVPVRPPSAPGMQRERSQQYANETGTALGRSRTQRPSIGLRDTSRPPPPRKSLLKPAARAPSVNLADEFGISNPYHTPTGSQSSNASGYSESQPSRASSTSTSSPARSMGSRRKPSDTSNFDALMSDLQSSMTSLDSGTKLPPSADQIVPASDRRMRPNEDRFDPAVQGLRAARPRSPLASPPESYSDRIDPAVQGGRSRSPAPRAAHARQPSAGRSRGDCKACQLPITGKSISSADGRLTGRYHKACFVCTTCQSPFTTAEFYVLGDKPYDAPCYHRLNGSLCTSCGYGIEGQYLEDDSTHKHHPECFRCFDCNKLLQDGYFEVNGRAYCERDAWKRVQQPMPARGRDGMRPPQNGRLGLPSGNRLAPPGMRPRMEKRMTRLGMI